MALIVVADDDELIRSVLCEALTRCGHRVVEAKNGLECLRVMQAETPDLIMVDIFMPELDGLGTVQEVADNWPSVKVICMSSGGEHKVMDYLEFSKEFGANQVLRKPFSVKQAADLVRDTLAAPLQSQHSSVSC